MDEERIPSTARPVIHEPIKHPRSKSLQQDYRHSMPEPEIPRLAHIVKQSRLQQRRLSMCLSLEAACQMEPVAPVAQGHGPEKPQLRGRQKPLRQLPILPSDPCRESLRKLPDAIHLHPQHRLHDEQIGSYEDKS